MPLVFPKIVGIINTTPDSFSDGGLYFQTSDAVDHALRLIDEGAEALDIGGESTRPGSQSVSVAEELDRIEPVITQIRRHNLTIPLSIDTQKSDVARRAIQSGANIVNDVSAGRTDAHMFSVVAQERVPIVVMHMNGNPKTMQDNPDYTNVCEEVFDFLHDRIVAARAAGIEHVIADVGIGFGKSVDHNLKLLRQHQSFLHLGVPLMLGISRKRFLGSICSLDTASERDLSTALLHALLLHSGASYIRVHNVANLIQLKRLSSAFFG